MLQLFNDEEHPSSFTNGLSSEFVRLLPRHERRRDALDVLQGQVLRNEMHRRQMPVREMPFRNEGQAGDRSDSDLITRKPRKATATTG